MSGFVLIPNPAGAIVQALQQQYGASLAAMRRKPLRMSAAIDAGGSALFLFANEHHDPAAAMSCKPSGDFLTYVGTLFYRGKTGHEASTQLLEDLEIRGDRVLDETFGNFCLIIKQRETLRVISDYAGLYHVYVNNCASIVTSSFIGAVAAISRPTFGAQEICEYILHGATFGDRTPVMEVHRCNSEEELRIVAGRSMMVPRRSLWMEGSALYGRMSVEDQLQLSSERGQQYFSAVASNFPSKVTGALSGGFDSRLVLAFLQSQAVVPQLFVYGKASDPDVVVAKKLCAAEGLEIHHEDRDAVPPLEPEAYWQNQEHVFHGLDGVTQYGFACDPTELSHRVARVRGGLIAVNGGCGEIWRNFWQLPDKSYSVRQWLRCFYDRTGNDVFTGTLGRHEFLAHLGEKAVHAIGRESGRLSREEVESLYPRFRVRFWQGPNNGADNVAGMAVTPFAEHQFTIPSMWIPVRYKSDGWFERQLMIRHSKSLAGYPSSYGFDFLSGPRLHRRLLASARSRFPVALRPVVRRMEKPDLRPYYLGKRYVAARFGTGPLEVERHIRTDRLHEALAYSRALTIERMLRNEWQ